MTLNKAVMELLEAEPVQELKLVDPVNNNLPVIFFDPEKYLTASTEEIRQMIGDLEEVLKLFPQVEIPLKHYFSPGVYGREITFKKDTLIIGKIHKNQTMNVLSSGEVSVFSVDGVMRFKAPHTFVSCPGAKRVIYAHEDSTWTNFHGTHETDIEKIEEEFIAKDYDDVYLEAPRESREVLSISSTPEEE